MEIVRMVTRFDDHVESFPTLDAFVDFVRKEAQKATQEDIPDNLISVHFSSDYDTSYASLVIKTPQTVDELREEIRHKKAVEEKHKAYIEAKERQEYERLKIKFDKI